MRRALPHKLNIGGATNQHVDLGLLLLLLLDGVRGRLR